MTKKRKTAPDASPNSLEQANVDAQKNGRRAAGIFICIIAVMLGILLFALNNSGNKREKEVAPPKTQMETTPLIYSTEGHGVAQIPKEKLDETEALAGDNKPAGQLNFNIVGGQKEKTETPDAFLKEQEELRRLKMQYGQSALVSPIGVKRQSTSAYSETTNARAENNNYGGGNVALSEYDPAANIDKEAFFIRADHTLTGGWVSPYTREQGRNFEIKTGSVIPAIMISGINSDLPGNLIAQVSQNIYDSATGKYLLIPRGSKLYGVYDSRVVYGQERVLIAWNRIIYPDGSSVTLGAMPGVDMSGYAGFSDKVNNHYFRIFGSAVMMSLISGGMSYALDELSNTDSDSDSTTVQDEMASAFASQLGQTSLALLQKNLNISPTLEIRPGYVFNVILTKDIVFEGVYNDR